MKGLGSDIVNIQRIEKLYLRFGRKLLTRLLSKQEIIIFDKRHPTHQLPYLAKRFAAKEAYIKAINSKPSPAFNEISILNDRNGCPQIYIDDQLAKNTLISLSDDYPYAFAVVVIF
jgi:holo-[acyl-carrier protein] synthase